MIKLLQIIEESNKSLLEYKFTPASALAIVKKILNELPKEYTKGLKFKFGNNVTGENNSYYDKYSDTLTLGKELFYELSTDWNYWNEFFKDMPKKERMKYKVILTSDNDYGLSGRQIGYENLRNVLYHEIGHRVDYINEFRKKYSRLKPKQSSTVSKYQSYYSEREEELDNKAPKVMYQRRIQAEQFAENFRMYWIEKNGYK